MSTRSPRLPSGGSALGSAARRVLRVPGVPYRRYRLGAQYSQRSGVSPANPLGGRRRELCTACGVQASGKQGFGGLVGIIAAGVDTGVTLGHVSVVGSTLSNISVRAHC